MWKQWRAHIANWGAHTPLRNLPVRVRKGLAKGARWTLLPHTSYWRGNTEIEVETAIQRQGDLRGMTCWDLGTHFGIYTVGMALAVGPTGQVVGFEPDPVSFARCRRHVEMNRLSWVKLYNAAVSSVAGSAELILHQGRGATTSHLPYEGEESGGAARTVVHTVHLDTLVEQSEILPPRFIKVDVEGHGAKALGGAVHTITRHRPAIVMSFHSAWEVGGIRQLLEPLRYRAIACPSGANVPWPADDFRGTLLLAC